jgi:hypothetical protein
MTDKEFKKLTSRLDSIISEWATGRNPRLVSLREWSKTITFSRERAESENNQGAETWINSIGAETTANWPYKEVKIVFYAPALVNHSNLELELVVVHELCHAMVNEMREWGGVSDENDQAAKIRHEERVVTDLTNSFLQTKYRDFKGNIRNLTK